MKYRSIIGLIFSIIHAFCVFFVWFYEEQKGIRLLPTFAWMLMAWAWLVWPVVFILKKKYLNLVLTCLASVILFFPTLTTIWFVTSVYIFGFAP